MDGAKGQMVIKVLENVGPEIYLRRIRIGSRGILCGERFGWLCVIFG